MDWDEPKASPAMSIDLGQDLLTLSVSELQQLTLALETELVRLRAEIETKKARAAAADDFFKR